MKNLSLLLLALLSSWSIAFSQNQTVCQNASDSLGIEIQVLANASCAGSCDGFAYAQAYYGSGNYVYSWTGPNGYVATQPTVSALCAGTYTVIVTDVITGISCTLTASVSEPSPINLITTTQAETCTGACDGIMIVGATGGVPPYLYSIDNGANWSTNQTYINLCAGTYPITVMDANGCQHSDVFIVNSNGVFITNVNTTDETSSSSNGSVEIISNGGVSPYTYTLNGTSQATNTFSGLSAGTYYACVTDANGCTDCDTVQINNITSCNLLANTISTGTCVGFCNGTITVYATGGSGNYEYSLDNSNWSSSNVFSGQCEGPQVVYVRDLMDTTCMAIHTAYVFEHPAMNASLLVDQHPTGGCNGQISASVPGGSGSYIIDWHECTGGYLGNSTTTMLGSLCAGGYYAFIQDVSTGCVDTTDCVYLIDTCGSISINPYILANPSPGNCDGELDATITGTSGSYVAYWIDCSSGNIVHTTPNWFGACGSTSYALVVDDVNTGCLDTSSCIYVADSGTTCNMASTYNVQPSACGACDGSIFLYTTGGQLPYIAILDGTDIQTYTSSTLFSNVCGGWHTIVISDNNNCYDTLSVYVYEYSTITLNQTGSSNETSPGASDGSVSYSATGGTGPYSYNLAGTINSSGVFTNLSTGWYSICVTDANGCEECDSAYVGLDTTSCNMIATYNVLNESCSGSCDGLVEVYVTGGTMPYQVSLDGTTLMATSVVTFNNVCSGLHQLYIIDANGCTYFDPNVMVGANSQVNLSYTTGNESSTGAADGSVYANATGGTAPYVYNLSGISNTSGNFNGLNSGWYYLCATDTLGCEDCDSVYVGLDTMSCNMQATSTNFPASCDGICDGGFVLYITGGTAPYTATAGGQTATGGSALTFGGMCTGTYVVNIVDANGCSTVWTVYVPYNSSVNLAQNTTNESTTGASDGTITLSASGGTAPYWYTVTGVGSNSTGNFTGLSTGWYEVCAMDTLGCQQCDSAYVGIDSVNCNIVATYTVINESCAGSCDGLVEVYMTGGTMPYIVYLDGVPMTGTSVVGFSNVCSGYHQLYITDANGCSFFDPNVLVGANSQVTLSHTAQNESTPGASNGSVTATASGGTAPYSYNLAGTINSTGVFNGLTSGWYSLCATDDLGCETCDSVYIGIDSSGTNCNYQIYAMGGDPTCAGSCDGYAYVTSNGNIVSYQWSNGMTVPTLSGLCAGTYCVIATDVNGCQVDTCITLTDPAPITLSVNSIPASSQGANDGTMVVIASGGTPDYSYSLDGGTYTPYTQTWTFSGLGVGWHYLCAQDSMGCETCDSVYMDYSNSISDINSDWTFDVYPNPSDDVINIKLPSVSNGDIIQLMDARGRILFRDLLQSDIESISLARYAAERGIYMITIIHDGSTYHKKVVYQ